jgi:hypothetical protein
MSRALGVLIVLVALAAAASPAAAHWDGGQDLITAGKFRRAWPTPVIATNGDAMALWSETDGSVDERWKVGTWPVAGGSTTLDFAPGSGTAVGLATGGGAAVAAYAGDSSNDIHWRERPAGGAFGALQTLDLTGDEIASNHLAVAMNSHGDIAFVWAGTGIYAAVKPAGGSFSAPVKLGSEAFPAYFEARLSDSGELVAAWTDDNGVHAGRRSASGQAAPEQTLVARNGKWFIDALAVDSGGDALLVWREIDGPDSGGKLALRGAGEDFAQAALPGVGLEDGAASAATMSASGLVTLAYHARVGIAVYSGQFGEPLHRVHTFGTVYREVSLATSPGGRAVISINPDFYHRLTAQRDGNGAWGPLEDLQPDCTDTSTPALAIDDAGHTVAGWGDYPSSSDFLALGDAGPGHRGCAPDESYSSDDASNPPPHGDPAGASIWGPVRALPPVTLADLNLGRPALLGSGATRTLKLDGTCGERCAAQGSVLVLRPNGRVIQKVPVWFDGGAEGKLAIRTKIALSPKTLFKLSGKSLEIELKLYLTDQWNRGVRRSFTARGAKVSAASAARVRRCARARCRRTA